MDFYKTSMKVNNPVPWIGMPIYVKGCGWTFVKEFNVYGRAIVELGSIALNSYHSCQTDDPNSVFLLPGDPNTPEVDSYFDGKLYCAYTFHDTCVVVRKNGKWESVNTDDFNPDKGKSLWLPDLPPPHEVLINNNANINVQLKSLNTDGRTSCAQCGTPLKMPIPFWTNMNYCPKCET